MPPMRQRCAEEVNRTTTDLVLAGMPTSRVRGTPRGRAWRYCGGNSGACGDSRAPNRHLRRPNVGITSWMPTRGLRTGETRSRANLAVRSQMGVDLQRHTQRTHGRPIHAVRPTSLDRRRQPESEHSGHCDAQSLRISTRFRSHGGAWGRSRRSRGL